MMIQKYKRRLKGLQMRIAMWQSNQLFKNTVTFGPFLKSCQMNGKVDNKSRECVMCRSVAR